MHSYGIFPPKTLPGMRMVTVVEGSNDGEQWSEYEFTHQVCTERARPCFMAPIHLRIQYLVFYAAHGM